MATLRRRGWRRGVFSGMRSTSGNFSSKIISSFSFHLDTFIDRGPHTRAYQGSDIKKRKKNNLAQGNSTSSLLRWIKRKYRHFIRCSFSESSKKMRIRHQILTETMVPKTKKKYYMFPSIPHITIADLSLTLFFSLIFSSSIYDFFPTAISRPYW